MGESANPYHRLRGGGDLEGKRNTKKEDDMVLEREGPGWARFESTHGDRGGKPKGGERSPLKKGEMAGRATPEDVPSPGIL